MNTLLGDTKLVFDVGDSFLFEGVVVVFPRVGEVEMPFGVKGSCDHPNLQVVNLGIFVEPFKFLFYAYYSIAQELEVNFVSILSIYVDHNG